MPTTGNTADDPARRLGEAAPARFRGTARIARVDLDFGRFRFNSGDSSLGPGSRTQKVYGTGGGVGRLRQLFSPRVRRRPPKRFDGALLLPGASLEMARQRLESPFAGLLDEPAAQRHPLLDRPQGLPERRLDPVVLGGEKCLRRESVAGAAAESQQVSFLDLPEDTPAIGAGHHRLHSGLVLGIERFPVEARDAPLVVHLGRRRRSLFDVDRLLRQPGDEGAQRIRGHDVVDLEVPHRVSRHVREKGLRRVLDDRDPPADLDGDGGRVVPSSSEPESTTPMTLGPQALPALRKRTSTEGRCVFLGALDDADPAGSTIR